MQPAAAALHANWPLLQYNMPVFAVIKLFVKVDAMSAFT
jgi:hypothetical protein